LVHFQHISAKIHSKCASQPKIAKNHLKPIFWGFKVVQGHRCWESPESLSAVLVMSHRGYVSAQNFNFAHNPPSKWVIFSPNVVLWVKIFRQEEHFPTG